MAIYIHIYILNENLKLIQLIHVLEVQVSSTHLNQERKLISAFLFLSLMCMLRPKIHSISLGDTDV